MDPSYRFMGKVLGTEEFRVQEPDLTRPGGNPDQPRYGTASRSYRGAIDSVSLAMTRFVEVLAWGSSIEGIRMECAESLQRSKERRMQKKSMMSTRMIRAVTLGVLILTLLTVFFAGRASAHYYSGCQKFKCKHHVIAPYETNFLRFTGHCESRNGYPYGSRHGELKTGLGATSPAGYFGRYQFGWDDWARAGGWGDPRNAPWYEQAYRAVIWLNRNGRQSWPNC